MLALLLSRADRAVGLRDRLCSPRLPAVSDAQRTAVVRVPGFLSDSEIENIHCAAAALREERGEASRSNGLGAATWKTVYFNHLLAERLPWLRSRLHATAREVDSQQRWGVLDGQRAASSATCGVSRGRHALSHGRSAWLRMGAGNWTRLVRERRAERERAQKE